MLPDYLPNVHPLLVHFPIVLLVLGVLVDIVAIATARHKAIRDLATVLIVLGALSLVPTYLAGRQAGDQVTSPFARSDALLSEHADAAWLTLWAFLGIAAVRVAVAWRGRLGGKLHGALVVVGAAGLFLLVETADHGGQLVYDLGVGVRPVRQAPEGVFDPPPAFDPAEIGPRAGEHGALRWRFVPGSETVLAQYLTPLVGTLPSASMENRQSALVLEMNADEPVLLAFGEELADSRVGVMVNLDEFDGTFALLHHVAGADTYDSLVVEPDRLFLGRRRADGVSVLGEEAALDASGWHLFEVVGAGTHLRGYLDGKMIVHGHAPMGPPGRSGLLIEGAGLVRIDDLRVQALEE